MGLARWVTAAGICAALGWTACGGDSFTGGQGTGGNASGGTGGSSANGGVGGSAGSSSAGSAGSGTAGMGGTGTAGTGTAGTGTGGGGNGGTGGIPPDYSSCNGPGQCVLVPSNCCGYCSEPTIDDFLAVNAASESSFYEQNCGDFQDCPSCITVEPGNFTAMCRNGTCQRVNVYDDDKLVGCETSDDCRLRWGAQCCEACAPQPDQLIAVAKGAIEQNQCGGGPCPGCASAPYPSDASAECGSNHRCTIVYAN